MKFVITFHAQQRMDRYGINPEQIKLVIQRGSKVPQTDGFLATYTHLSVAYKIQGDTYIIKTVMVNR